MFKFFRDKMKAILLSIVVIFAATMFYGLGYRGLKGDFSPKYKNEGLATVNGRQVDPFRFNQMVNRLVSQSKTSLDPISLVTVQTIALSQVIDFTIMQQDAEKHFSASGSEVDRAISDIMNANKIPDQRTFDKILRSQGFNIDNLKRMIGDEIITQKQIAKIKGDVVLTPDDMREIRVQHVLIAVDPKGSGNEQDEAKKKAEMVLGLAKSGKDFAGLARQYSDDKASAKKGGDLGFFRKGMMVKDFESAAFALKPGEVSDLVKTPFGYHIIKMNESRLRQDSDKDKMLAEKRDNIFNQWLFELKSKAKVVITNHLLNAFNMRLRGDQAGALSEYKNAIEAQPQSAYPHLFYADMLTQTGDTATAAGEYNKASNLAGPDSYAHLYIGKAYLGAGKAGKGQTAESYAESAKQEFIKASILAGENLQVHESLAKFFKDLKLNDLLSQENEKIAKLKEKAKFEQEIQRKATEATMEGK